MYTYEIADILFFMKSIRSPTSSFNINNYITRNPLLHGGPKHYLEL